MILLQKEVVCLYTYVLEKADICFLNLAGILARAINILFLAALGKSDQVESIEILKVLSEMKISDFMDGGFLVNQFVDDLKTKDRF